MPAKSVRQQQFFGLVRRVQRGEVPLSDVTQSVQDAAKKMKPKDVREFAATKHDKLPEKAANLESQVKKVQMAARSVTAARRAALESQLGELRSLAKKQQTDLAAAQQSQQAAEAARGQDAATMQAQMAAQAQLPQPPPAQTPYGRFLTGMGNEQNQNGNSQQQ